MHTIDSLIRESCRRYSGKTALRHKLAGAWHDVTYGELWEQSDRIAAGLVQTGFNPGNHAALLAPSSPQWDAAYLVILQAGVVVIPIDKELKSAELRHILVDSDARVVFSAPPCLDPVLEIITDIPSLELVVTLAPSTDVSESQISRAMGALLDEWRDLVIY